MKNLTHFEFIENSIPQKFCSLMKILFALLREIWCNQQRIILHIIESTIKNPQTSSFRFCFAFPLINFARMALDRQFCVIHFYSRVLLLLLTKKIVLNGESGKNFINYFYVHMVGCFLYHTIIKFVHIINNLSAFISSPIQWNMFLLK